MPARPPTQEDFCVTAGPAPRQDHRGGEFGATVFGGDNRLSVFVCHSSSSDLRAGLDWVAVDPRGAPLVPRDLRGCVAVDQPQDQSTFQRVSRQ